MTKKTEEPEIQISTSSKNAIAFLKAIALILSSLGIGVAGGYASNSSSSKEMQDRIKQVSEICNTNAERLAAAERVIELQAQTNQDVKADLAQIRKDITMILVILQDKKTSHEGYER